MSSVLTFTRRADGTVVAQTAVATDAGAVLTPGGQVAAPGAVTPAPHRALGLLRTDPGGGTAQLLFGPGDGGVATDDDARRLAERFLVHLGTTSGSVLYRKTQGCLFFQKLVTGRATTEADVFAAFAASLPALQRNLQAEEQDADPPAGRFQSAQMTRLMVAAGTVTAAIAVRNRAGATLGVTVPITLRL